MTLYYKPNETPSLPPSRIVLANGLSRTNYSYTTEELLEAGYIAAPPKPSVTFPQRVEWVHNYWVISDPSEGETNRQIAFIRSQCVERLAATDYIVLKAQETGVSVSDDWKTYRQALRDLYNLIDAPNIWNVEWPQKP